MRLSLILWIGVQLLQIADTATEVLKNHDMEMVDFDNNWTCQGGCTLTSSNDSYSGYHSVMVTNRRKTFHGVEQAVNVTVGANYNFTAFIKLLSLEPETMYQTVELMLQCQNGADGKPANIKFVRVPYVRKDEWTRLGGIEDVPQGSHSCSVYVKVFGPYVNYLLDHASLQMLEVNNNWRAEANTRIENLRKADVTISMTGTFSGSYDVELVQTDHDFAFGCGVRAPHVVDPIYKKNQDVIYDNFEWAVLKNALKWKMMEKSQGDVIYDTPLAAVNALRSHGMKIRAHNIFWGGESHIPPWVLLLSNADLLQAMKNRSDGVVGATKGLVDHWDVNNENIHGDWYERKFGNPNITMQMFRDAHRVDPNVKLFLNDFAIMERTAAVPYLNQAKLFKEAGVPIYGIGVQSHIKNSNLDMSRLKANLDTMAEAGLPIWITELTVNDSNVDRRASALTDILTLYFSHPSVEGIMLWGHWDSKPDDVFVALFNGPNVTANAAGRAYQELYKTTWRTHETRTIHDVTPVTVRGFKGNYNVTVKQNGQIMKSERFHLDERGQSIEVKIGADIIFG